MRQPLLVLVLAAAACAPTTPRFGLLYADDGDGPAIDLTAVDPNQIDTAFAAACDLAGVSPTTVTHKERVAVYLHHGPIAYEGRLYSGLTTDEMSRVMWSSCAFDPDNALIHELLHAVLYVETGNDDPNHTLPAWATVEARRSALSSTCPENESTGQQHVGDPNSPSGAVD